MFTQFVKTSRSISPVPPTDTTNWAKKNGMLVWRDDTQMPNRNTFKKNRNIVSATAASAADTNLDVYMSNDGASGMREMVGILLKSGEFNDLAIAHVKSLDDGDDDDSNKPVVNLKDIDTVDADYQTQSKEREIAEK